ncbi:MAG: four helix bundle protein [Acidobacteriia bacterium]|nr:four helix bundle protein [Terriglobia bacterium]
MRRAFRKIRAWQLADELALLVYSATKESPHDEMYGLVSQLRRASVSIASNIAEGSNRGTHRDYLHFLNIGSGSLAETEYLLHLAQRLNYLSPQQYQGIDAARRELAATLHGLTLAVESECMPKRKG